MSEAARRHDADLRPGQFQQHSGLRTRIGAPARRPDSTRRLRICSKRSFAIAFLHKPDFTKCVLVGRLVHGKGGTILIGMLCYMKELATGGIRSWRRWD